MGMPGREVLHPALQAAHNQGDGHSMHAPVLVLNASYEPINVCAARRAIVLVLKGVAAQCINGVWEWQIYWPE